MIVPIAFSVVLLSFGIWILSHAYRVVAETRLKYKPRTNERLIS